MQTPAGRPGAARRVRSEGRPECRTDAGVPGSDPCASRHGTGTASVLPTLRCSLNVRRAQSLRRVGGPDLGEVGPKSAYSGPSLADSTPSLTNVERDRAEFGRHRQNLIDIGPNLVESKQDLAECGHLCRAAAQIWTMLLARCGRVVRTWPARTADFGLMLVGVDRTRPQFGQTGPGFERMKPEGCRGRPCITKI